MPYSITCPTCNKQFTHYDKRKKYCNRKCYVITGSLNPNWIDGGTKLICTYCGKEYVRQSAQLRLKRYRGRFCSHHCYSASNKETRVNPSIRMSKKTNDRLMSRVLKGISKSRMFLLKFGYSEQEFIANIMSKLKEGMTIENLGTYWCIDHVVPLNHLRFERVGDEIFKKLYSLDNLQPLTLKENNNKAVKDRVNVHTIV